MSDPTAENGPERARFRFGEFVLDVSDRQLWRGDARLDLNARYLDALVLLVRENGRLVEKERLFDEVWSDVVVSDSALAQCIKEIRRQLGDDASNPRFIQTVPRHGYRFVAAVERIAVHEIPTLSPQSDAASAPVSRAAGMARQPWIDALAELGAGTLGGGTAGIFVGLIYGFALASGDGGAGTLSTLLVLISLTVLAGLIGGFGISAGFAAGGLASRYVPQTGVGLRIVGAAFGGLFFGALAKLLGVDAFNLLFGRAPAGITGGPEGAAIGAAIVVGGYAGKILGARAGSSKPWHAPAGAAVGGLLTGMMIPVADGHLLGGSLDLVARSFDESRLDLDRIGGLVGGVNFGLGAEIVLAGIEGLLFGACVVGALQYFLRFAETGRRASPS